MEYYIHDIDIVITVIKHYLISVLARPRRHLSDERAGRDGPTSRSFGSQRTALPRVVSQVHQQGNELGLFLAAAETLGWSPPHSTPLVFCTKT